VDLFHVLVACTSVVFVNSREFMENCRKNHFSACFPYGFIVFQDEYIFAKWSNCLPSNKKGHSVENKHAW